MPTLRIDIAAGEHWWGGRVSDGVRMPFDAATAFECDLRDNATNQASPLLLSDQGRVLWSDAAFTAAFSRGTIECRGDRPVSLHETHGTLRDAFLAARRMFFAAPEAIPAESLFRQPQYNTWIELMYDQEESAVLAYARRLLDEGYPSGVLMIDDNWQDDYGTWDFHPGRFTDPKGMVDALHGLGFEVMLWVCPFVSPDGLTFRRLRDAGALVTGDDERPHLSRWWNGHSAVLDLTRTPGREWFVRQLQFLTDTYGVDGFKFDAGDFSFYPRDGEAHCQAFNRVGAAFSHNEFRAAWKSADLPLAQRLADRCHAWDETGLASLVPNLIAQGLLGHPFVCPDMIGGGEYRSFVGDGFRADGELVVRYAQAAAWCPMMQFSVAPWRVLDARHAALCPEAARLHARMGPAILDIARSSAVTGEPMLRPMEYAYPGHGYADICDQFLLGDDILVAPVLVRGQSERTVHVPPGTWRADDGRAYVGPQAVDLPAPLERLIWLQRQVGVSATHS